MKILSDTNYEDCEISNEKFPLKIDDCDFRKVTFNKVDFSECDLSSLYFEKCKFINCDFSNCIFSKFAHKGNSYKNCRLIGVSFVESHLEDIVFDGCQMSYSNYSDSQINKVKWLRCNLEDASFIKLKKLNKPVFDDCNMSRCDFLETSLNNVDLRTCEIDGIRVGLSELRGLIVTSVQAVFLALILGINIKEVGEEL